MSPPETTTNTLASGPTDRPYNVLIIGANGYLGSAIGRAFLRTLIPPSLSPSSSGSSAISKSSSSYFRVYGLVRTPQAALSISKDEIIPIIGSLSSSPPSSSSRETLLTKIHTIQPTQIWDVIVTATEPPFTDSVSTKQQHFRDIQSLVKSLADKSVQTGGIRPLVLWSSGCKDYGTTCLHGDDGLVPHTEESQVVWHDVIRARTEAALKMLEVSNSQVEDAKFDVAVVRATPVFGYSGSYTGAGFNYVAKSLAAALKEEEEEAGFASGEGKKKNKRKKKKVLKFTADPGTIMHAVHVDDCAEGYVALATTALFGNSDSDVTSGRDKIRGQVFNISGRRYETLQETAVALAEEYGFDGGVEFGVAEDELPEGVSAFTSQLVFGWSQWVGSDKIRRVTGWRDFRPLFAENLRAYRLAYEAVSGGGELQDENVGKMRNRMEGVNNA